MDKKVIDWALENGMLNNLDELDTLDEMDVGIIEASYLEINGLAKILHLPQLQLENGERVPGKPYRAYIQENHEEAIRRELAEVGISTDGMSFDEAYQVYDSNYTVITERYKSNDGDDIDLLNTPIDG